MKIIQLKYFVGVVEARSFLSASRELNVAQSALSRQIGELERELGVSLMRRSRGGTEPTDVGYEFYQHAHLILEQLEAAQNCVQKSESHLSGEVNVGIMMSAVALIGPRLVQRMAQLYPNIQVSISEGLGDETGDVVEYGKINIGIVPNAHVLTRAKCIPILKEDLYLIKKRQASERQLGSISQEEAFAQKLILPSRNLDLRRHLEQLAIRNDLTLTAVTEQRSWATIRGLMLLDMGATIISWPAIHSLWEDCKIDAYHITGTKLERIISLAIPANRPPSNVTKATLEVLKDLIRSEVEYGNWRGSLLDNQTSAHSFAS